MFLLVVSTNIISSGRIDKTIPRSRERARRIERLIESKQDFLPKKENSDLRCLAWPFEMDPYSYRRTRRKKKGTCVIYPNSAINDKLLFPFVHYLLLEVKQLSQQVSLAKKKKKL